MRTSRIARVGPFLLLAAGGLYALGSVDWCGTWEPAARLLAAKSATGKLRAGAGRAELQVPFPVTVAGYPLPLGKVERSAEPLSARAIVLELGGLRVGMVAVDLLTIPKSLNEAAHSAAGGGWSQLWLLATHAHSSVGGYDPSPLAELAGTGKFRPEVERAVVEAVVRALGEAAKGMKETGLSILRTEVPALNVARSGPERDVRLTTLAFGDVGELVIFSAHPTMLGRGVEALHPDYPALFAKAREQSRGGVTLLVQGAAGNASTLGAAEPVELAARLAENLEEAPGSPRAEAEISLGFAKAEVALPKPDGSRLVPTFLTRVTDNALCRYAPKAAEVSVLRVGSFRLLFVPAEPTYAAGVVLERASGADRVVGLANGYIGYVETSASAQANDGEARRQYFGPDLLQWLERGATISAEAL